MAQSVLEKEQNICYVKSEGIISEDLQEYDQKIDLAHNKKVISRKSEDFSNYAKYHEHLIDIDKIKRRSVFKILKIY